MTKFFRKSAPILLVVCAASTILWSDTVPAGTSETRFSDWQTPRWASSLDGFEGSVRVEGIRPDAEAVAIFAYTGDDPREVVCTPDATDPAVMRFSIPAPAVARLGELIYRIEIRRGDERYQSAKRRVPVSYAEELDITGEAAQVLLYPLGDDGYVVRYIPCCNIYGGMTYAERVAVNPENTPAGLPDVLLSDFVVLEPDGLSASTMGLYFDFNYDLARELELDGDAIALYEFNGKNSWHEVLSYTLDQATQKISVHCPEGGVFVLGKKQ